MANIKVSEMTEATTFEDDDLAMIVQSNQNKKITKVNMLSDVTSDISDIQENITDINTNIGDITTLKTNVITNIVSGINSMMDAEVFSTTEVLTNKIWTDGKLIYKRTFSGSYTSSSSRVVIELMSDIAKVVNCYGMYSPNTSTPNTEFGAVQLGSAGGVDAYSQIQLTSSGVVRACFSTPQSAYSGLTGSYYVTIEYIKAEE